MSTPVPSKVTGTVTGSEGLDTGFADVFADPSADRRAVRGAVTVSERCDLYLEDANGRIKASTLAADRSRIETHVKPLIRHLTDGDVGAEIVPLRSVAV
jgi:hypothetical protein